MALLLRGAGPLLLVGLALLAGPTLAAWWLLGGGPLGWRQIVIGAAISLALLLGVGLALGWAMGRLRR